MRMLGLIPVLLIAEPALKERNSESVQSREVVASGGSPQVA